MKRSVHQKPCSDPKCPTCGQHRPPPETPSQEVSRKIQEVTDLVNQKPEIAAKILAQWIKEPKDSKKTKKTA